MVVVTPKIPPPSFIFHLPYTHIFAHICHSGAQSVSGHSILAPEINGNTRVIASAIAEHDLRENNFIYK